MTPAKKITAPKTAKKPAPKKAPAKKAPAKKTPAKKPAAKKSPPAKQAKPPAKVLMTAAQLDKAVNGLAGQIIKEFPTSTGLVLLGIRTRGVFLAERLKAILEKKYKSPVALGILDITFYRDDLSRLGPNPMVRGSELPFDIHDANVVLVDDVLYTGRTVRAAMDEISDFGRPALIRLAILVDRGLRELPIHPDYCALHVDTKQDDHIRVQLEETDEEENVLLGKQTK